MDIGKIKKVPLRTIWPKEDKHFTKWLEENIDCLNDALGFEITILSREQKVGPFSVDLYGEVNNEKVIIENQLEKTDHTHLGQIITYLTNLEAKTAIWISTKPVDEHKKAIEWLNETTPDDISFYLVQLEAITIEGCAKPAPLFTVIKAPSAEIKQIGAAKKRDAQIHSARKEFWTQFIDKMNAKNQLCSSTSPRADDWISIGFGMSGANINIVSRKTYARVEVYFNAGNKDKERNKKAFDSFHEKKEEIEAAFGGQLNWARMDENVTSRIIIQKDGVDVFNKGDWKKINEFLIENAVKMHGIFKEQAGRVKKKLREK